MVRYYLFISSNFRILILQDKRMLTYNIPTRDDGLCIRVLTMLNFKLHLSKLEIDMLTTMLNNNLTVANPDSKEVMRKTLNKSKYMINNYVTRLKDKNILVPTEDPRYFQIRPDLVELVKEREFCFRFDKV